MPDEDIDNPVVDDPALYDMSDADVAEVLGPIHERHTSGLPYVEDAQDADDDVAKPAEPVAPANDDDDLDEAGLQAVLDSRFQGDPLKVAKSFREAERKLGQQGNEVGELRKLVQEAGYFFDADGKPVKAEVPKVAEPEPVDTEPKRETDAHGNYKVGDMWYSPWDLPIVDEAMWSAYKDKEPNAYLDARIKYEAANTSKRDQWERDQAELKKSTTATLTTQAQAAVTSGEETAKAYFAEHGIADQPLALAALESAKESFLRQPLDIQATPGAFDAMLVAHIAPNMRSIINAAVEQEVAKRITNGALRKVVASQGGGLNPVETSSGVKLTTKENAMRVAFNKANNKQYTPEQWKNASS